jgi:shikimate kinase
MGTGKTTAGKLLADDLKMKFVEMDSIIEEREEMSIRKIFEERGEVYFRRLERGLVRELSSEEGLIISTGGGVVLNQENITDFEKNGINICLNAEPEEIYKRVKNEKHRPLLDVEDPPSKIKELLEYRKQFYGKIKIQIDTTGKNVKEVVEEIKKSI